MDSKRFDALTRGFGAHRSRREALMGFAAGLLGMGVAKGASAQVGAELATCGQSCSRDTDCNAGLRCSFSGRNGICVAIADSRSTCSRNINCGRDFEVCRDRRCVNVSTCTRCQVNSDCPSGDICRNGDCGGCTRDRQCGRNEICQNGRCKRNRNACRRNRDCRKKERCKNGRCKRRRRRNR